MNVTAEPYRSGGITRFDWTVEGNYGYGWDEVHCGENRKDALARLKEYRENCPGVPHRIRKVRQIQVADESRDLMHQLDADEVPPLPAGPCADGLYRADSGEIVRIHSGRPEPAF